MKHPIYIKEIHSAFSAEKPEEFNFAGESHDFWEMVFVEKGTVGITAGSRVFTCLPGTLVFHKPNEFHRIWNAGKSPILFTIISFSLDSDYARRLYNKVVSLSGETEQWMLSLKKQISENRGKNHFLPESFQAPGVPFGKFCATLELLLYACADAADQPREQATGNAAVFAAAVKTMRENIQNPLKAQELAEHLHISLSQLKRIFRQYASTGVHEYFLKMKMDTARQLLRQGQSVNMVSEAVGFDTPNYFSAAFKREIGVTPGEYRRQNQ